jgi:4-hydroxyacetophenone monooxygenase
MTQDDARELLTASDAEIDDAVQYADPMALRASLYQLTGDEELRDIELTMLRINGFREQAQVGSAADAARIRDKAAAFLKSYRDSGAGHLDPGPAERLPQSLSAAVGIAIPAEELELWLEELALDPWARGLTWSGPNSAARAAGFSVVIIGAGMGGLNAAVQLKRTGIPFTVLEKNSGVGGTWHENRYPGARVDTPSVTYSHIYGVGFDKPYPFCPQSENEKYMNWMADTFEVRGDIQFDTEVKSIIWDDAADQWVITAEHADGQQVVRANAVISSVGFLSRPNIPRLEGIDDFQGQSFHTARWPAGLDLSGKNVAVIGSGCTGYQLVPEVVKEAGHVYIFQRTPSWIRPVPGYLSPYPEQARWLKQVFPYLANFSRFQAAFQMHPQNTLAGLRADPDFQDEHAVSATNLAMRDEQVAFLRSKLGGRPDLMEKMTPKAPPMSSRPVLVDKDCSVLDALLLDNVTLVTEGIARVSEKFIELSDGTRVPADIIVLATGFKANDFLWPMEVRGRAGLRVEELWARDGARAYLGTMLPGFPNFFMIYGPNTNLLQGMQIVGFEELTTRFALECFAGLIETGKHSVEVTVEAYWRYNDEVDKAEKLMTYMDPRASNYYQNGLGRSAANMPLDTRLLWGWLRDPAGRAAGPEPTVDASLRDQYEAIHPVFGEDLVVE